MTDVARHERPKGRLGLALDEPAQQGHDIQFFFHHL